jgi:hypothetical protein
MYRHGTDGEEQLIVQHDQAEANAAVQEVRVVFNLLQQIFVIYLHQWDALTVYIDPPLFKHTPLTLPFSSHTH